MPPERSSRKNDPIVRHPTNAPPCTDFITAVPMSVTMDISLHRSYLTLVKTKHKETLLKAQKSYTKVGKLRHRPQFRIYSERGKEVIISCDKKRRWDLTWPNQPHRTCQLVEHTRYFDVMFSNPFEEGMTVEIGHFREQKVLNKATGRVLATVRARGFWQPLNTNIIMMDKDVDVVLITGFMIITAEILHRRAAAANVGGVMVHDGGC